MWKTFLCYENSFDVSFVLLCETSFEKYFIVFASNKSAEEEKKLFILKPHFVFKNKKNIFPET